MKNLLNASADIPVSVAACGHQINGATQVQATANKILRGCNVRDNR